MNSYPITELEDGTTFSDHLFLDETFQLLDAEVPFTDSMKKALAAWDFRIVLSDGKAKPPEKEPEVDEEGKEVPPPPQKDIPKNVNYESVDLENLLGLPHIEQPKEPEPPPPPMDVPDLDDLFGSLDAPIDFIPAEPETAPQEENIAPKVPEKETANAQEKLASVRAFYNEYLDYIDTLFKTYTQTKSLDMPSISEKIEALCACITENQRYLLRIMPTDEAKNKHFLVNHSMRSTVLALIIGITLKLPKEKLTDLGIACLLHEIGQIRLPQELYMTDRQLSEAEKGKMATHPILSYTILKEHNFPVSIQLAALEHHEREDGTGYPRKLKGEKISAFAKIISVACSYEAITAPRQFREARTTYEAMVEMLQNRDHSYDEVVIRALLHSLSLFPIGAFVQLANGKVAQVIDANPGHPKHPIVQIVGETAEIASNDAELKIMRVLNNQESEAIKNTAE